MPENISFYHRSRAQGKVFRGFLRKMTTAWAASWVADICQLAFITSDSLLTLSIELAYEGLREKAGRAKAENLPDFKREEMLMSSCFWTLF
jgi:hypothetical protein